MKRLPLIALVVFIVLAGMLAFSRFHNREPSYQGRTLTQWLEEAEYKKTFGIRIEARLIACTNALKQMGTNAIPFLVKRITARDSAFEARIKLLLGKQSVINFHFKDDDREAGLAWVGFNLLGKDAESAIPALTTLTKDSDKTKRHLALIMIEATLPEKEVFLPILLRSLHDQDISPRTISARILARLFPGEAEKAGVFKEFPELKPGGTNTNLNARQ
jgi:hypothetical protein